MLARSAPRGWERIELNFRLWDGAVQFEATGHFSAAAPVSLDVRPELRLHELFQRVQAITREVAEPGTPTWTTARFLLRRDGTSDLKFGYEEDDSAPSAPPTIAAPSPTPRRPWWRFWGK